MTRRRLISVGALALTGMLALSACGSGGDPRNGGSGSQEGKVTLTIESWRTEDAALWKDKIIPAFTKAHPGISIVYNPTKSTEYDAALESRLKAGTAGDIMACRPFDRLQKVTQYLTPLTDARELKKYPQLAISAWSSNSGTPYCIPIASTASGYYYNKDAFKKLGLQVPKTEAEFMAVLDAIKKDGTYTPLAFGTGDEYPTSQWAMYTLGPNYWKGETGRLGLIDGSVKFTDPGFVAAFTAAKAWKPYLPNGFEAVTYTDMQQLFGLGKAAIFPGGSWEIAGFEKSAKFEIGVFPAPTPQAGSECYITNNADIAMGANAASKHPEEARTFLSWLATSEFADTYANSLPGFLPLINEKIEIKDSLANEFKGFTSTCKPTERLTNQYLNANTPSTEQVLRKEVIAMWTQDQSPTVTAQNIQKSLDSWFVPKK